MFTCFPTQINRISTILDFSPDGRFLIAAPEHIGDHEVVPGSFSEYEPLTGHQANITQVTISPDGRYLLSGSLDKMMIFWDFQKGHIIQSFRGHEGQINSKDADLTILLTHIGFNEDKALASRIKESDGVDRFLEKYKNG